MRHFAILFFLTLCLAAPALAAFEGPADKNSLGGFSGPSEVNGAATVQEAKKLPDDAFVMLTGNIVRQVGNEHYIFRDATGEIHVDIDHKYFNGQTVSPKDTIRISGEVDKEFGRDIEIDVKKLEILQ